MVVPTSMADSTFLERLAGRKAPGDERELVVLPVQGKKASDHGAGCGCGDGGSCGCG